MQLNTGGSRSLNPHQQPVILSLSCVFPNPAQPTYGTFVRARLEALAEFASIRVIAPIPIFQYAVSSKRAVRLAADEQIGALHVSHPRWLYPPKGGVANSAFLAARVYPTFRSLCSEAGCDVIDAHFAYPDGIAAALLAKLLNRPFVITLRGNEPMHAKKFFRRKAIRWAIGRADRIVTVSEQLKQFAIASGAAPENVHVISNGIDTNVFHSHPGSGLHTRLQIPPTSKIVLSVGYLIERKGHHHVMRAVSTLRNRGLDVHLGIVGSPGGEGNFEPELRRLCDELRGSGYVHFLGSLAPVEVAKMMSESSLVCLASTREGWPNVVNEALACGTPVVASAVGGAVEMLSNPEHGILLPDLQADTLAAALVTALDKSWDRAAIAKHGSSRSWQHVAEECLTVLQAAATSHRGQV